MKNSPLITTAGVSHLAKLAKLTPPDSLLPALQSGVERTLEYAKVLSQVDVSQVEATNEVSGLTNVLREDVVDDTRTFTQTEALQNAPATHKGFFMVNAILE
jgi:aspartyl/glutamyl-tRNA(Asn/Gln) amidotransferase C subunit